MKLKGEHLVPADTATEIVHRIGKDEMNLAEFPITLLADRAPKGVNLIRYQDQIFDSSLNQTVNRKLTITAPEEYGLPTAIDDDVLFALIQVTNNYNGFSNREVKFTRYELIEMLQWDHTGQSYRRLTMSLRRWVSAYLDYENAWWDKRSQAWITRGFHILDNFELHESKSRKGQGELFASSITWNKVIFASFQAGYLKNIDYDLYMRFQHQVSKRLYRFLSKRFYRGDQVLSLSDLAFEHVGLSRNYKDYGKIKEKLEPALDELESVGFLEPLSREDRYQKNGKEWTIRLVEGKKRPSVTLPSVEVPEREPDPEAAKAASELAARGVTKGKAEELAERFSAEQILAKIEVFDWLLSRKDKRVQKSPAGYLVSSILHDYVAPKGFVSKAEREAQEKAAKAAKQKAEESLRKKREQEAREEEESRLLAQKAKEYLSSLSPADRAQVEKDALGAAGHLRELPSFREGIIRSHVIRLLGLAEPPTA